MTLRIQEHDEFVTAIHEAAHAVLSHLLDVAIIHAQLIDPQNGEVVPECSCCQTCVRFYETHPPEDTEQSQIIRDDIRKDIAVAVAGELAEIAIIGEVKSEMQELESDHERARQRTSLLHIWSESKCYNLRWWREVSKCDICDGYVGEMRARVAEVLRLSENQDGIRGLAAELQRRRRMMGWEIRSFLASKGLAPGAVSVETLPLPPASTTVDDSAR